MTTTRDLLLCCNNHPTGMFQGWIEDVQIGRGVGFENSIELNGPRLKVSVGKPISKIGRVNVKSIYCCEWVGNWCWDLVRVSDEDARRVLNYLKSRRWTCNCAPEVFYDRWLVPGEITVDEWRELMEATT